MVLVHPFDDLVKIPTKESLLFSRRKGNSEKENLFVP